MNSRSLGGDRGSRRWECQPRQASVTSLRGAVRWFAGRGWQRAPWRRTRGGRPPPQRKVAAAVPSHWGPPAECEQGMAGLRRCSRGFLAQREPTSRSCEAMSAFEGPSRPATCGPLPRPDARAPRTEGLTSLLP